MFPPRAPFFRGRSDVRAAEIAAFVGEHAGGNLPVSPFPFHVSAHAATLVVTSDNSCAAVRPDRTALSIVAGQPVAVQAPARVTFGREVNGPGRHPIYTELTAVPDAGGEAGDVLWNFEKFLVGPDGTVLARFRPQVTPEDPELVAAIEANLPG